MLENAIRHLESFDDPNFKGNCATTVLHALLGRLEPNPRHIQAVYEGLYDITHLAAVVAVELYEQSGCYSNLYVPDENGCVLDLFRDIRKLVKSSPQTEFVGGIISTNSLNPDGLVDHVFAVTKLYKKGKYQIIDTSPSGLNPATPYIRKKSRTIFDRAKTAEISNYSAIAITTKPLSYLEQANPKELEIANRDYLIWKDVVNQFLWYAEYGQYED